MLDLSERKRFDNNGYIAYFIPEHHLSGGCGIVYEHMLIAEEMLGRDLNEGEVVHHKDENKKNNSVDNLMVFKTKSDHTAFHMGHDIKLEGDVYIALNKEDATTCPICKKQKSYGAGVCLDCYKKELANKSNIPSKEELCELLSNNNMCEIGRMFNVSDNAVRKWCKKYNLPFRHRDIKEFFAKE